MKKNILTVILLLVLNLYAKFAMSDVNIQNKLTNLNPFPTIDIGVNTNQIKAELTSDLVHGVTKNGILYFSKVVIASKKWFNIPDDRYKKFLWDTFTVGTADDKVTDFSYGFCEEFMDYENYKDGTVRSQTNYEQKLPIVMEYLYQKHGTNYQAIRQIGEYPNNLSIRDAVDIIIYWEKSDGKVYSFTYSRLNKTSVNRPPLYVYRGFKDKNDFDVFLRMKNGDRDSLPADAPSLATLTAEHKALEQKYKLLE